MFVPVACSQCGKPFQVPEATVGKPTVCPWCSATVAALPVGAPAPAAAPEPAPEPLPPPEPEPLPLDDAPGTAGVPPRVAPAPQPPVAAARAPRLWWAVAGAVALLSLAVAAGTTVGVKRYKQGHGVSWEWKPYADPEKAFSLELLGRPTEDPEVPPGEKRFVSEGWYSGTRAWVGWKDLTANQAQLAADKEAWQHFRADFETERDRLKTKHGGTLTKSATVKFEDPLTYEVRLEQGQTRAIERMIVMPRGPKPRLYYVGMAGRIDFDGPDVRRLFDSLRVTE